MVSGARSLRTVFFGTPFFAAPSLERLARSHHQVVAVVTQPDRPAGRGQQTSPPAIKRLAVSHGIAVLQPERIADAEFRDALAGLHPDIGVVAAYGKILPTAVLDTPALGMINVHASLLPRWRGAAPVQRAIMAGDTKTGVTIMRVVPELDAGPVLASRARAIGADDTSEAVEKELAVIGADLMLSVLDQIARGQAREVPQDERQATYAPRLRREDGRIDWASPAAAIHNKVRGLHPWPHAFAYLDAARYIILETAVDPTLAHAAGSGRAPGRILQAAGDTLLVATGDAALRILRLQPEGRRAMLARDFLAGYPVQAGSAFR